MDEQRKKQAEEIAELRELHGMTFKAIAERYQISPGKVSYLYHDLQRLRRLARYRELREAQNQITVSFSLTLGEAVILQRLLLFYQKRVFAESARRGDLADDPDYNTSEALLRRLFRLEHETREKARQEA
ncbi:MAG: hypothetical protein HFF04_05970 [Oscillospiraceae bacterium]|nr:hypothetical protein [Oscillospiraceae bacterium]